jgi:magnesium transporter
MGSLKYPLESAGRWMTSLVPVVQTKATVGDIEKILSQKSQEFETINYIYVVNRDKKLKGVCSIKELFRSKKGVAVSKVMVEEVIKVRAYTDQEKVARLALKHSLKAVPVVDIKDRFLGVVPADKILQVLDTEAAEDQLHLGGVWHAGKFENVLEISIFESLKRRMPWLILGLFGGLFAAGVVRSFEEVLSKNLILAAFIPLVVYMAGAVGMQMQTFIVRDLAVGTKFKFSKYFSRQLGVVCLISLLISVLLYFSSLFLYGEAGISLGMAVALFFAILSSVFTGLLIPFVFERLKFDPADAGGPIAMIVQDVLSIFVYLLVVSVWL